ncbi:unannotated protein [freshwater metagenome]|uniref:Unannotated protein n=1 Tax=freshwater metagenome TaxID=449393 RepID=A0A6J6WRT4_9ZZZZ
MPPIACPSCVAMSEPIKVRSRPAMAPMGPAIDSPESGSCDCCAIASSRREEIAEVSPVASGSIVACQPLRVSSTQSSRLTARADVFPEVAGKTVASLSQRSAISNALSTTVTSFVPMGCDPCACTNFFAVSRTTACGSASCEPCAKAANGLTKPAGLTPSTLIPSCSNCF